jgi:hypothetical protein
MAQEVHLNDIGTVFRVTLLDGTTPVDVSTASVMSLHFKKGETGTVITKTATHFTDGTDGIIEYIAVPGDINEEGLWKIQAEITFPGGSRFAAEVGSFVVNAIVF